MKPAERDKKALELRRAGVTVARIREELKFSSIAMTEKSIARALERQGLGVDPVSVRDLELDRLDRLQQGVWVKATKGDPAAIDRVLRLAEMRMRIAGVAGADETPMLDAFETTLTALNVTDQHKGLVALGRSIASQIDAAKQSMDATALTKALYLGPHLMSVMRELGVSPATRKLVAAPVPEEGTATVSKLDEYLSKQGISG
ncbi:hypothetical protein [Pseudoclavibacter sp. RFBB5]|uniref:terminase small subunit n=1 Tax=Pseudoclavibacter sp. RFBB5 TaxID=2080574 RepID=UPI000CE82380|nr:hypothetical protein [Pseudoclavibacter sp. RFBB5]PPG29654.1 hypothetical protein C5B97_11835 [Pseudoclavibacter sp. RFBB5]